MIRLMRKLKNKGQVKPQVHAVRKGGSGTRDVVFFPVYVGWILYYKSLYRYSPPEGGRGLEIF